MADQQTSNSTEGGTPSEITTKCHILALPAELRLDIYNYYFADCISHSTNDNGSALLEVCRTIRTEAIPECEKLLKAQIATLDDSYAASTGRYLKVRALWATGTRPIFLSGMVLIRGDLDRISRERYELSEMLKKIREVREREKAEDAFSLMVLEEKGTGGIQWA